MYTKEFVPTDIQPVAHGFSHAVKVTADTLLFISGQGAWNSEGRFVGEDDFAAQLHQTMENIRSLLQSAGADFVNIVRYTAFVTDHEAFVRHHGIIEAYFGAPAPAASTVQVVRLFDPRMMVQIDVVAAL